MENYIMDNLVVKSNISNQVGSDTSGFSPVLLVLAGVTTFIIMTVGIFGNFLTVAALYKCPKVRNVAATFIISLCMADLLFCAIVLPFSAMRFIYGTWTNGSFLCKLIPFIQYGNIGVSLLCIAMITINRYVMIAHHGSYSKIYKKHWIAVMVVFCWSFSYGMQLPTLLGVWGKFDYDQKLETCSIMIDNNGRSSKTTLFITAFIIPGIVITACYTKIFWVVRQSELRLKRHANQENSIPNNLRSIPTAASTVIESGQKRVSSHLESDSSFSLEIKQEIKAKPSRFKDQREQRAKRNEWRITKMVLAIFLSFVICYLPITIAKVADKDVEHPNYHIFSYIMLYLSACINPIIYVIMNKQYRKAYKTVIMCKPSKLLTFTKAEKGGNIAAEKWKDIGLSNNHSRTIVSQISIGEQQSSTSSHTYLQQHSLELTNEQFIQEPLENQSTMISGRRSIQKIHQIKQVTPIVMQKKQIKELKPIILLGNDIILEEEEETTHPSQSEPLTLITMMKRDAALKKAPSYGQNINVIPDNSVKLLDKQKI